MTTDDRDERSAEQLLEALAHGREELVPEAVLEALDAEDPAWREDPAHKQDVAVARALSIDIGLAFDAAPPPIPDVSAMVSAALAAVPPAPSRRSLALSGMLAAVGAAVLGAISFGMPTRAELLDAGRGMLGLVGGLDRLVALLPGGWTGLAFLLGIGVLLLALPARAIARRSSVAVALFAMGIGLSAGSVHAQELRGVWPAQESSVTVHVDQARAATVLRAATTSVGLGLVGQLEGDERVGVHLDNASLADVVRAVLPDGYIVERTAELLIVQRAPTTAVPTPAAPVPAVPSAPAAVPAVPDVPVTAAVPAVPAVPATPTTSTVGAIVGERTSWGEDIVVGLTERVRAVTTAGGDATILGEVLANVVTMGGDVHVGPSATVRGDVVTMGGDVEIAPGGTVDGRLVTMGGEVKREGAASEPAESTEAPSRFGERVAGVGAKYALLFLLGLVLLGGMRERHAALAAAVVKQPVRAGFFGALGLTTALLLIVVLAITIIGLPAALMVGLAAVLGIYVGAAVVASVLGAVLPLEVLANRPVAQLTAGTLVLFAVSLLPGFVSMMILLVVACVGFGAVVLTRFGGRRLEDT